MKGKSVEAKEEGLAWLLNLIGDFPQNELQSPNMRPMRQEQFGQLKNSDEILSSPIYTYDVERGEFIQQKFTLLPNILIMTNDNGKPGHLAVPSPQQNNAQYLILSNCTITKKILQYKQSQAFGMILTNSIGNTYMFFPQFVLHRNWYKQLKQYCKLTGFLEKYKLGEKILPGFYSCVKKKNQTQYTVQIYKIDDFDQCQELEEAVHNEIHILRSIRHQSLLELKRVYENPKYLFIVYEFYKGESLFKLFNSGLQLHEVQVASIIYQTLQLIKFLSQHQFYHGSLNPQNILINTQHQMLQITVINLSFKEYKVNDKLDWILNRAVENFLAPEIYEGIAPSIQSDLYAIGCILYFMTFYDSSQYQLANDDKDFYHVMDNFEIDISHVINQEKELSKRFGQQITNQTKTPISASQIDLLKKLLEKDANKRMTMKEATKHHWFVNVKNKIKSMKHERKRKKPLPSLRTIIELREQSEMDIRMTIIQHQQSGINPMGSRITNIPQNPSQQQIKVGKSTFLLQKERQHSPFDEELEVPEDCELNLEVRAFSTDIWDRTNMKSAYTSKYGTILEKNQSVYDHQTNF